MGKSNEKRRAEPEQSEGAVLAKSWVEDPAAGSTRWQDARVRVLLVAGPEGVGLSCPELRHFARDRDALLARLRAGETVDDKGAAALAALIAALPEIIDPDFGIRRDAFGGAFLPLYIRYETHSLFTRAFRLERPKHVDPRAALVNAQLEATAYWRVRRDEDDDDAERPRLVYRFDQPLGAVIGAVVGSDRRDSYWEVPIAAGWRESVLDEGLAVVASKLVVGRDPGDPRVLYAIARADGAYRVCAFRYDPSRGRLKVIPLPGPAGFSPSAPTILRSRASEAKLRVQARGSAAGKAPKREAERYPVVCRTKGPDADLDGVVGTLTIDYEDGRPTIVTFDPDDERIDNAEMQVVRWFESGDTIGITDPDGDRYLFVQVDGDARDEDDFDHDDDDDPDDDDPDFDPDHPFNEDFEL